jgi:lipoprotein-releasing system permease protein
VNTAFFISRRLAGRQTDRSYSRPVVFIATLSVGLGIMVMIMAIAIVTGFQQQIKAKISGFSAHLQVVNFDNNNSYESIPVSMNQEFVPVLKSRPEIQSVQAVATKPGILKNGRDIHGVILKGVGADYDWSFFKNSLKEGKVFSVSSDTMREAGNEVVISSAIARRMNMKLGDTVTAYFINRPGEKMPDVRSPQRAPRSYVICGIYETGLSEYDERFIVADIMQIQELNNWFYDKVSGYEIVLKDFSDLEFEKESVLPFIPSDLKVTTIRELNPAIFDWLAYMDINVLIIIVLMIVVSIMAMVSALLILMLERTRMIGILKALGMSNSMLRSVFLWQGATIILTGLIAGNVLGIGLCILQLVFGFIPLDQESYYLTTVPVDLDVWTLLWINGMVLVCCMLMLLLPARIVSGISPVKAIRMD